MWGGADRGSVAVHPRLCHHAGRQPHGDRGGVRRTAGRGVDRWAKGSGYVRHRRARCAAADAEVLTRSAEAGLPEFRTAVVNHLLRHRGLAVAPDAVLATGGTTAAVAELAAVLLRPGDVVAVEEPGYPRAVGALRAAGLRVLPAPVDSGGLVSPRCPTTPGRCTALRRISTRWAPPFPRAAGWHWWPGPASAGRGCWRMTTTGNCAITVYPCHCWLPWASACARGMWWYISVPRARSSPRRWVSVGWPLPARWWPRSARTGPTSGYGRRRPVSGSSPHWRCPETFPGTCAGSAENCSPGATCWSAHCARRACRDAATRRAGTWWSTYRGRKPSAARYAAHGVKGCYWTGWHAATTARPFTTG